MSLDEYQASFEELEEKEEEGENESYLNDALEAVKVGLDDGEIIMIRMTLSGLAIQENHEQREAIVQARCTVGGNISLPTINGGKLC